MNNELSEDSRMAITSFIEDNWEAFKTQLADRGIEDTEAEALLILGQLEEL